MRKMGSILGMEEEVSRGVIEGEAGKMVGGEVREEVQVEGRGVGEERRGVYMEGEEGRVEGEEG